MARWEMVGRDEPATQWEEALARLVDGLSEHAPGNRPPYKGDGTGYLAGSRLAQAEELFSSLWGAGTNTERSSLEDVRAWGDTAGMPLARYLDRDSIVQWLREDNPVWREKHLRQSTIRLHRKPLATLQAVDRAGIDRTYKKRERVHLAIGGADQEGEIVYCTFIAGPTPGDLVQPAVRVRLADAQTAQALAIAGGYEQMWGAATQDVFVPIAQVELVKKSKS